MSKIRKARRLRTPNLPDETPVVTSPTASLSSYAARTEPTQTANFDYTHTRNDLRRIFLLAGIILAVLVGLSFVIP
jgi:hypothetical protein